MVVGQVRARELGDALHFKLRRGQRRRQVGIHGRRVLRDVENLGTPQHHRLIEADLARALRPDRDRQIERAGGVEAGVQANRIGARRQRDLCLAEAAALGRQLHLGRAGLRHGNHRIDGELFARERNRREADRLQPQCRPRLSGNRVGVDGNAQLLRLPGGARDAALVLLAVGNQRDARHQAGGQRGRGFPDRRFQIGGASLIARGRLHLERFQFLAGAQRPR